MGIKSWLKAPAPIAVFTAGGFALYADKIEKIVEKESHPLAGVTARVEAGSDLERRVTATRLVAMGVFAFAAKKKKGGEVYLTIEGPDFFWTAEVDRKKAKDARAFAAKVNDQARKSG